MKAEDEKIHKLKKTEMYVTRPLSMYRKFPSTLSLPPPEGPNSGILVFEDEEAERTYCYGLCKSFHLRQLPFPQNKRLTVSYDDNYNRVILIPVLNQPLSSNLYYVIEASRKHKGKAFINSTEEDKTACCFCNLISDRQPQPFDPNNIYQQFEICKGERIGFSTKSVAQDGFPPLFLRRKGWTITARTHHSFELGEAGGLDTTLRIRLPDLNFPLSYKSSKPVVVGKWYCPFMFVKEGTPEQQISSSIYYEMTLEQRWEQIFTSENSRNRDNIAVVDVVVQTEIASFGGIQVVPDEKNLVDGIMWFRSLNKEGGEQGVGLGTLITERMKWKQERFGWIGGDNRQVRVKKLEEFEGIGEWKKFGCYALVERFVLKRMDGKLVSTYDFKHTNQIRGKWE